MWTCDCGRGEGDGLDCQLPSGEAVHEKGAGGAGADRHHGEVKMKDSLEKIVKIEL